ncbi:hypothetical protein AB0M36_26980 [Actinoplanes sp. NPDC051346]|uniref:hypothetical protein n=1 Tax=Actinoplanes sp. NPDC051346 TaxID=3155048 RepID=UPI00342F9D13
MTDLPHPPAGDLTGPPPVPTVLKVVLAIAIAAIVGICGVSCAGFYVYANHDRPGLLDSPEVSDAADAACATMRATVAGQVLPPKATNEQKASFMGTQDAAVVAMVAEIRGLGTSRLADDLPAEDWLADWETLLRVRQQYAVDLVAGRKPSFVAPVVNGFPLVNRMNSVSVGCKVPAQLLSVP